MHPASLQLFAENYKRLEALDEAVKKMLAQKFDDICWRDLYTELAHLVGVKWEAELLPKDIFLANCAKFHDSLATGCKYQTPQESLEIAAGHHGPVMVNSVFSSAEAHRTHSERQATIEKDAIRWRYIADCAQTALMLGSHLDPNENHEHDWLTECNRLVDEKIRINDPIPLEDLG